MNQVSTSENRKIQLLLSPENKEQHALKIIRELEPKTHEGVSAINPFKNAKVDCNNCGKSVWRRYFQDHLKYYCQVKTSMCCPKCARFFTENRILLRHFRQVHSETLPRFDCRVCGEVFSSFESIRKHLNKVHLISTFELSQWYAITIDRTYPCRICDIQLRNVHIVKQHLYSKHEIHAELEELRNMLEEENVNDCVENGTNSVVFVESNQIGQFSIGDKSEISTDSEKEQEDYLDEDDYVQFIAENVNDYVDKETNSVVFVESNQIEQFNIGDNSEISNDSEKEQEAYLAEDNYVQSRAENVNDGVGKEMNSVVFVESNQIDQFSIADNSEISIDSQKEQEAHVNEDGYAQFRADILDKLKIEIDEETLDDVGLCGGVSENSNEEHVTEQSVLQIPTYGEFTSEEVASENDPLAQNTEIHPSDGGGKDEIDITEDSIWQTFTCGEFGSEEVASEDEKISQNTAIEKEGKKYGFKTFTIEQNKIKATQYGEFVSLQDVASDASSVPKNTEIDISDETMISTPTHTDATCLDSQKDMVRVSRIENGSEIEEVIERSRLHTSTYLHELASKKFTSEVSNDKIDVKNTNSFVCEICDKTCMSRYGLRMHKQVHVSVKLACDICGLFCQSQIEFEKHKRLHALKTIKSGPFSSDYLDPYEDKIDCSICGKSIAIASLEQHTNTHDNVLLRIPCPKCPGNYSNNRGLMSHLRLFHCETPLYKCRLCGAVFSASLSVRMHIKKFHSINPLNFSIYFSISINQTYPCIICGSRLSNFYYIEQHLKAEHQMFVKLKDVRNMYENIRNTSD